MYITLDKSGMFLWMARARPKIKNDVFEQSEATKIRLPVSWFGGIVEMEQCKVFDLESLAYKDILDYERIAV